MRIDCVGLLNASGIVKTRPFGLAGLSITPFGKGRVLESSILDDNEKRIALSVFSTKVNPAKYSEIIVRVGDDEDSEQNGQPFLSLERNHGNIKVLQGMSINCIRRANLKDAREWKEVVDALKEQKQ